MGVLGSEFCSFFWVGCQIGWGQRRFRSKHFLQASEKTFGLESVVQIQTNRVQPVVFPLALPAPCICAPFADIELPAPQSRPCSLIFTSVSPDTDNTCARLIGTPDPVVSVVVHVTSTTHTFDAIYLIIKLISSECVSSPRLLSSYSFQFYMRISTQRLVDGDLFTNL